MGDVAPGCSLVILAPDPAHCRRGLGRGQKRRLDGGQHLATARCVALTRHLPVGVALGGGIVDGYFFAGANGAECDEHCSWPHARVWAAAMVEKLKRGPGLDPYVLRDTNEVRPGIIVSARHMGVVYESAAKRRDCLPRCKSAAGIDANAVDTALSRIQKAWRYIWQGVASAVPHEIPQRKSIVVGVAEVRTSQREM